MMVLFAGLIAPDGWLLCHGQTIRKDHCPNLCEILPEGTEPGTSIVPDLRGRVAVGEGTGIGLHTRSTGQTDGHEWHSLTNDELPEHDHAVQSNSEAGSVGTPALAFFAASQVDRSGGVPIDTPFHHTANSTGATGILSETGNNAGHNNLMPCIALNFIIKM